MAGKFPCSLASQAWRCSSRQTAIRRNTPLQPQKCPPFLQPINNVCTLLLCVTPPRCCHGTLSIRATRSLTQSPLLTKSSSSTRSTSGSRSFVLLRQNNHSRNHCLSSPSPSYHCYHRHHAVSSERASLFPSSRLFHRFSSKSSSAASSAASSASSSSSSPPPPFLQNLTNEIRLLLQDLRLFLPRILACIATLHLTSEYGLNTVPCEGPSMEPTILDGRNTVVLMERWSHRLFGLETGRDGAISTAVINNTENWWIPLLKGVWQQHFSSGLQRGDVIILHHPSKEGTICKRIIGMPGDVIVRNDGWDGGSSSLSLSLSSSSSRQYQQQQSQIQIQQQGRKSQIQQLNANMEKIPPGHLWIEGDNAPQSHDSRAYGSIPASLVIGKVICRLWPLRDHVFLKNNSNNGEQDANNNNGMEQPRWRRIDGRIGRGERPGGDYCFEGSTTSVVVVNLDVENDSSTDGR